MMKTYEKGAIGEHRVVADLINQGYRVHKPLVDSLPYDIVVRVKGFFYTVQVKYVTLKNNTIDTAPRRIKKAGGAKERNKEFDILAIFCPDTNQCYYVWKDDFESSVRLRVNKVKNGQNLGVRYAKDYTKIKLKSEERD